MENTKESAPEEDEPRADFRLADALTEQLELPRRREGVTGWLSLLGLADRRLSGAS